MAKIIKKIEIEYIDLPKDKPFYQTVSVSPFTAIALENATPLERTMPQEITTYERVKLYNPETNEKEDYFVNVDDRGLFKELTIVSDSFINSKIKKETKEALDNYRNYELPRKLHEERSKTILEIKSLPFWRRLFNKF